MSDRELTKLAAKATGLSVIESRRRGRGIAVRHDIGGKPFDARWDPLHDDGDRYQLLSKLKAHIDFDSQMVMIGSVCIRWPEDEPNEARAIVRAAAEIGRTNQ